MYHRLANCNFHFKISNFCIKALDSEILIKQGLTSNNGDKKNICKDYFKSATMLSLEILLIIVCLHYVSAVLFYQTERSGEGINLY